MGLFKVAQIKKMLGCVSAEQMTFSRMVELLNEDVNKEVYRVRRGRGEPDASMVDILDVIDSYLFQHKDTISTETEVKLISLREYIRNKIVEDCIEIYNSKK